MARTSATISVGADTRQLERDIQKALGRDFKFKGLNEKAFTQPLGRITGAANEFQKSLDASNARVIAFGASAGLIYSVERAFTSLVKSTIDVQKSLTDINVILNVSTKSLQTFGAGLFNIAKDTAQSFDTVAQAATEFSRQGLGLEETLKRTRDALILTRLSGLDTVSAVEALTATINSFSEAALDSTTIINKLANVDAAFAVSSADLAEAIKRVGSSAQDVGVDFDELLAIVTSVQQTTARGGAVIGNSLKTIFTRIQRTDTLDQLERLGIQVRTLEGNTLPAVQILSNLATTFNQLSDSQRAQVAETVGGVFQINILRAALADLGKEYSVYSRALQTSTTATDEAISRNEKLNETLSALINRTFVNLTELGAEFGKISLQPTFEGGLNLLNKGLESLTTDSQGIGSRVAKGIFEGIGTFVSGPGVILLTAVFGKLFLNLAKFASESLKALLNINTQSEQRAQIQTRINQVLAQEPGLVQAVYNKQISVLDVENKILNIIRQQTLERERAASLSTSIAGGLLGRGVTAKGGTLKAKSGGFIPNFAMSEIFGALAGGYSPGNIRRMNIPGEGSITYNSAEKVKRFPGLTQPAIMPPSQSMAGENYKNQFNSIYGFDPYASKGFIPNFSVSSLISQTLKGNIAEEKALSQLKTKKEQEQYKQGLANAKLEPKFYNASKLGIVGVVGASGPTTAQTTFSKIGFPGDERKITFQGIQARTIKDLQGNILKDENEFSRTINALFVDPLTKLATNIFGPINPDPNFLRILQSNARGGINLFPKGTEGSIFEAAVNLGTKTGTGALEKAFNQDTAQKPFDFEEASPPTSKFNEVFNFNPYVIKADAKRVIDDVARRDIIQKAYQIGSGVPGLPAGKRIKNAAKGFIPNFTALNDAIDRELGAGVSPSRIRIGTDKRLTSAYNPLGLGVYNTQDEPLGLGQGVSRMGSKARMNGAFNGLIPNFVNLPTTFMGDPKVLQYQISALTETQNKSTKQLVRDFKDLSRETRNASRGFQNFTGAALALSVGVPIILQTLSQFSSNEDIKTQAAINGISTALSFIGTGAFVGAGMGRAGGLYGAGAGALIGAGIGTYQFIQSLKTEDLQKLQKDLQFLQDEFQSSQSSLQKVIPLIEEYKKVQASAADEQTKAFSLEKIVNEISTGLSPLGEETVNKVLEAIQNADYDTIGLIINKKLAESSAQLSNEAVKVFLKGFEGKQITAPRDAKIIGKNLLSMQTSTGESVIRRLAATEEGKKRIDIVSKNLEKLLEQRIQLEKELRENPPIEIGMGGFYDPGEFGGMSSTQMDIRDSLEKAEKQLNINLNSILDTLAPIYQDTEETRAKFAEWKIAAGSTSLNQESATALILQIVKDLRSQGFSTKKIDEILRTSAIDSIEAYVQAFKTNTLTLRKADQFIKNTLFKRLQDPMEILGKEQAGLMQNIGEDILTPFRRERVYDQIDKEAEKLRSQLDDEIIRREKLDAQLANKEITEEQYSKEIEKTIITEDQYRKRLEALREKILLDRRKAGGIFAEDFRGGRQEARESRILGQQTQLRDFSDAFLDEFDYKTEDAYRDIQLGAKETARTIKSEFNNAFYEFSQGSVTAGQAFERFALNIANKIQQLAFEFSTNVIFDKLLGSTGGAGGTLIDFFSSLGKSKGGIIKGYSSGGNVTGGSGTRDDVPAMLSAGEYVIRKNAVKKYGPEYLQMLNEGKVSKKFAGGSLMQQITANNIQSIFGGIAGQIAAQKSSVIGVPSANTFSSIAPNNRDRDSAYFKYGGRVQKFATGGELQFLGQNVYRYNDPLFPTGGENVIDPRLSLRAILDPSNPQNKIRQEREQTLYDYLNYVADVNESNRRALEENIRINQEIQDQYQNKKRQGSISSYMAFGMNLLGGGLSLKNGGHINKFASGGQNKDNVPALLMDGEFVVRKQAVNLYGKRFFDDLNSGRVKKFANGGVVGNGSRNESGTISNPTNNVNITINMEHGAPVEKSNTTVSSNSMDLMSQKSKAEAMLFASKVRDQVMLVINEQQRPGGLLSSSVYKKIG